MLLQSGEYFLWMRGCKQSTILMRDVFGLEKTYGALIGENKKTTAIKVIFLI